MEPPSRPTQADPGVTGGDSELDERYHALAEQVPGVTYTVSLGGGMSPSYISSRVEELLGYALEEWRQRPSLWYELVHPDDRERVRSGWAAAAQTLEDRDVEYRMMARDGRTVWIRDQARVITNDAGRPHSWQGLFVDITHSKEIEQALRESEERYRTLVEQLPAVVYIDSNDEEAKNLYTSPRSHSLFGIPQADFDRWLEMIHPDDRDRVLAEWRTSIRTGEQFSAEYRIFTPSGDERWVSDQALLLRDAQGEPRFWQGVTHDVSAEKLTQQQLEESEAKYRAMVENIPVIAYVVAPDGNGTTLYVNPQVERLLGYARQEWLNQPDIWMELLHPDDREPTLAAYDQHNETGEPWSREYRLIASDGRAIWFRDEATLVRDGDGIPLFWQGVRLDVSAQKLAEESLRQAHDELELRVRERTSALEEANELMMLEVLERRRAEGLHLEAEERYRHLVERIPAVTYIWDTNPLRPESKNYTSPQVERMLGYSSAEWNSGNFWLDRVHPHDRDRVAAASLRSETTGEPFGEEYRYLGRDGRVVWVLDEATLLSRGNDGSPKLFQGVMLDVTERREGRARLHRAEARASMLAEHLPAISYMCELGTAPRIRGSSTYVSSQLETILGYSIDEWLSGDSLWESCLHPDDRERVLETIEGDETHGFQWGIEYRCLAKDGRVVWLRDIGSTTEIEGTPVISGLMIDITEERESRDRLLVAEERYRTLVEQVPAIIYIEVADPSDPAGSMVYISPQSESILGYTPEELLAEPDHILRMVHPDDLDGYLEASGRSDATGEPFFCEYRVVRRDGELVWIQSRAVLVRGERGEPRFWHGLALDITERKRTEEELREIEERFLELTGSVYEERDPPSA